MFVNAATNIRNVAINKSLPKGMGKGTQTAISATIAAVGGGQLADQALDLILQVYSPFITSSTLCQEGNILGEILKLQINFSRLFQFDDKDQCKAIHMKWLSGFDSDDLEEMQQRKILAAFFYQVFTCYNLQFWRMLPSKAGNRVTPTLSYSWEGAMQKLADDSVHR